MCANTRWKIKYYHPKEVVYTHPNYGDLHIFKLMTTKDLQMQKGYFSRLLGDVGRMH